MNYEKIYNQLCEKRKKEKPPKNVYTEKHHIIPRSLGGDNSKDNVIEVTAKEHYICHYLLCKIHHSGPNHWKMIKAFGMMNWCEDNIQNRYRSNSRTYKWVREKFAKAQAYQQSGLKNSNYGKIWITNGETSKLIIKKEKIPIGWKKGRTIKNTINANIGKMWITDGTKNKLVSKNTLIPNDWKRGLKSNPKPILEPKEKSDRLKDRNYIPNLSYKLEICGKCKIELKHQKNAIFAKLHYEKMLHKGYKNIEDYVKNENLNINKRTLYSWFKKYNTKHFS